jgi:hypothetical protein
VFVHADHDEGALRGGGGDRREPGDPVGSEHRLVDDHHGGRHVREQPREVLRARRRRERLDARLRLEKAPEGRSDGLVAGGDEDGDRRLGDVGGVRGHVDKHRPVGRAAHQGLRLNRRP